MFGIGRTAPAYSQPSRYHHSGVGTTYGNQHYHAAPSSGGHRSHHTTHTTHRRHQRHASPAKAVRYVETSSAPHTHSHHHHHTGGTHHTTGAGYGHSHHSGGGHHYGHSHNHTGRHGGYDSHSPVGGYIYGPPATAGSYNTVGGYGAHPHQGYTSSNHHSTKTHVPLSMKIKQALGMRPSTHQGYPTTTTSSRRTYY